ncbi:MAG TPA: hypothetical protein VGM23_06930 [Armatimonadota bacterium]
MTARLLLVVGLLGILAVLLAGCIDGNAPANAPNTVSFSVYDLNTRQVVTPAWIAYQDGVNGAWTPLTGSSPYTLPVTNPAGAYGVAFVVGQGEESTLEIMHATRGDNSAVIYPVWVPEAGITSVRRTAGRRSAPGRRAARAVYWTQSGDILNPPAGMDFRAYAEGDGSGASDLTSLVGLTYNLQFYSGEPSDVAYLLGDVSGDAAVPGCLYLRRGRDFVAGATVGEDIDFTLPPSSSRYTYPCTRQVFAVPGMDQFSISLLTANGMSLILFSMEEPNITYFAPDASALISTDRLCFWGQNTATNSSIQCITQTPLTAETLLAPFTFTFDQSAGIVMEGLQHPGATFYNFWFYAAESDEEANICVTAAWLQAAGVTDYTVPDLSGVAGWQTNWGQPVTAPLFFACGGEAVYCNGTPSAYLLGSDEWLSVGTNFIAKSARCSPLEE